MLLDKYQPSLEVGIGFTLKGNGVTIEKRPDYLGETPTLLFATPKVLGEDFFSSLLQEGISYNGPNRDAFESKGTLTSGRYEVTLWAYDLNRPAVRISNLARVYLWIQKSNPPTLTFPLDKAIVYAIPQQFSWTVAPNSNGLTTPRYKFMLYELNDPNRDPADEVMSSEPFYQEEVMTPSFSYLTYHPQLIRGKRYAWRIQAVAYDQNMQEVPLFNNNGFSAIRSFSYGQDATSTLKRQLAIEAKSKNPYTLDVKVVADATGKTDTPDGFKVEYRKAGAQEWSKVEVDDDYTTLAKLTPNTEYELRGYPRMGALYGDAGPVVKARTQSPPEVKCGVKSSYKPDASTKLANLATGDIVTANQIPFTITGVTNSDGSFTGTAYAGVPFFGGKKLSYKLNNATFNSKFELIGGSIVADTIGIERYINKKVVEQNEKAATANEKKGDILADEKTVKVGGDIKDVTSIKVDTSDKEHPKAIVTTADGKQQTVDIPKNGTITLADNTGEVYTASSDGTVNNIGMYAGAASGTGSMAGSVQQKPKKLYGADLLVEFQPDPQQLYGFDNPFSLGNNFWKEKYDTTRVAGRIFFVPAKMVAAGTTDKVNVTLKGEAAEHPDSLIFTTTTGMRYMASPLLSKGTLQLNLAGGAPDSHQELTAWMKQGDSTVAVGRLSIDAYQAISRRVVIVPVGDATFDQAAALAKGLNDIYKQAAVKWDATVADQVLPMPEGVGESIKVDKSLLSAYSAGMRKIRSAFTSTSTYQSLGEQDIYYIFLTTLPMQGEDGNAGFDGYMPYGKPFGFVRSVSLSNDKLAWVIAHELGHGAFQLQHVWKEQGYTSDTHNLMGYSETGELFRWQWQDIHHPVSHSNLLADEEDLGATSCWYYWSVIKGGWIPSKNVQNCLYTEKAMNICGYFSAKQVKEIEYRKGQERLRIKEIQENYQRQIAELEWEKSQNPLYIIYKLSPASSATDSYIEFSKGNNGWGLLNAAFALMDLNSVKGMLSATVRMPNSISLNNFWHADPYARNFAVRGLVKGIEVLDAGARITKAIGSPIFDVIEKGKGVVIRTVNDIGNEVYSNLVSTIDNIALAKHVGTVAGITGEIKVTSTQLEVVLPNSNQISEAKRLTHYAESNGVKVNFSELKQTPNGLVAEKLAVGKVVAKTGNYFKNIDEFKAAIARGENVFYIGKHSDITPRPTGVQSHHGVNSVWMERNYSNYVPDNAPSIYMLNSPNHNATRGVFNKWRAEMATIQGSSKIDYSKITQVEILKLAEKQFDAANVPKALRDEYYKLWKEYLKTLTKK
jgi:hypothetical protein